MFKHAYIIVPVPRGLCSSTTRSVASKRLSCLRGQRLPAATCQSGCSHSSVREVHIRTPDDTYDDSDHSIDGQGKRTSTSGSNADAGTPPRDRVYAKAQIKSRSGNFVLQAPVLEKETFESWMIEVQEAMEKENLTLKEIWKRAKAWKVGKAGREDEDGDEEEGKERKKVDYVKEDRLVKSREVDVSRRRADVRMTDGRRDEASGTVETSEDATHTNPYLNYLLPVYRPLRCGYRRLADLSFIEADARLGLFTEVYNYPIPWRRRGGRGDVTRKWDDLAVWRWEKTTGENATWLRSNAEERDKELRAKREKWETRNREIQKHNLKTEGEEDRSPVVCYGE